MTRAALLDPEFETLSPDDVRRVQDAAWSTQWEHVRRHSTFYRNKLAGHAGQEMTLDSLQEMPFTEKDDLRESQQRQPPFGDYLAAPKTAVRRLHTTSGTTGRALTIVHGKADVDWTAKVGGRAFYAAGLRPGHRVVHCLSYRMWTGGVTDHMSLEAAGACVIPFGVGGAEQLIDAINLYGADTISCTPSYPALLASLLYNSGRDPRELGLKLGLFGGEAGLDSQEFRRSIEVTWGLSVRNANYGMSEVISILGSQSECTTDLHFHAADVVFAEIVDPAGARLPIREGATGELVCTHLRRECQPLIRYRTRDVVTVTGTGVAGCGRTSWRFRVTGRTDDMFNVRGVNVFPSAIQAAILGRSDIGNGQFRIHLRGPGPWDRIELTAEAARGLPTTAFDGAARELEAWVKKITGASAAVTLVTADTFPRTDAKTSLVERLSS